jgi:hypothetical protein
VIFIKHSRNMFTKVACINTMYNFTNGVVKLRFLPNYQTMLRINTEGIDNLIIMK